MLPKIVINTEKFRHNLEWAKKLLSERGFSFMLVTKGFGAMPELCAIAEPYVDYFGDSRVMNLMKMPKTKPRVLIRLPMPSYAPQVVEHADISLNTELSTVRALDKAAGAAGKVHKIILMADLGDLREGYFSKAEMMADAAEIRRMKNISICGAGVSLSCYGGVIPTRPVMETMAAWAAELEDFLGYKLEIVSGGNSTSVGLLTSGLMPEGINNLRLGECVICGADPSTGCPMPGFLQGVFTLESEIVELKRKPSVPLGPTGLNAYGEKQEFTDRGVRSRALFAVGRQDISPGALKPVDGRMIILNASSDHLIVDVEDTAGEYRPGDTALFEMAYPSILHACLSPYVEKVLV